jgi:methionyl-tRNA formyltransferase
MRVICLAYHLIGQMGLRYFLEETDEKVVAVFSHEDAQGEEIWWPSVRDLAKRSGVPVHTPENIDEPRWVERIASLRPDFILSFWYRFLVQRPILQLAQGGCLNLHGSLLPKYRGRAPVNWVLVNGEQKTGVTLHYMIPRADAGDIVGQAVVPIEFEDTALTLYHKLAGAGLEVMRASWPLLRSGNAPRIPQDEAQASCCGRRTPEDGRFSWDSPALNIHNLVRAVTHPYPGAFTEYGGRKLFVWSAHAMSGILRPCAPSPGTILGVAEEGISVATGEGTLLLRRVQLEGEQELAGCDFAARHNIDRGFSLRSTGAY